MSLKFQGLWTLTFLFLAKFFSMVCNGSFIHLIIYLLLSEFMIPKAPPFRSPPLLNPIFLEMLRPSIIVLAFGPFPKNSLLLSLPMTHAPHTRVLLHRTPSFDSPRKQLGELKKMLYVSVPWQYLNTPAASLEVAYQPHLLLRSLKDTDSSRNYFCL